MTYRFADERLDYTDLAPGRVFSGLPGHPAFPVRLADEIFQRCLAFIRSRGGTLPLTLYDPCCGCAYLLSVVALLHGDRLARVVGSDADPSVLPLASRNLSCLTARGIDARIAKLEELHSLHGKDSHAEALVSARRLRDLVATRERAHEVAVDVFTADATFQDGPREKLGEESVDVVIVDVPYGRQSEWLHFPRVSDLSGPEAAPPQPSPWTGRESWSPVDGGPVGGRAYGGSISGSAAGGDDLSLDREPTWHLLDALRPILRRGGVVAVVSDKQQRPAHEGYRRLDKIKIGKRQVVFLAPLDSDRPAAASTPLEQEGASVERHADA